MILVTGAAGFIGSCMAGFLNENGYSDLILCDDFSRIDKKLNWEEKKFQHQISRNNIFEFIQNQKNSIRGIIHLGARTDTTYHKWDIFEELNLNFSKQLWNFATKNQIPFLYASSAATYGDGKNGFIDSHEIISELKPLNLYGKSKNDFDIWVLQQKEIPPHWYGFKFFNVYGPNEFHKGRMASVIFHTFGQIQKTNKMKLFRSHHPNFKDGEQSRDFIYVKDVIKTLYYFLEQKPKNGIYNLGTGKARSFNDLASQVFISLGLKPNIEFIDTPKDIRDNYQYFTEADSNKLASTIPFLKSFYSLENGIDDYVKNYLQLNQYF